MTLAAIDSFDMYNGLAADIGLQTKWTPYSVVDAHTNLVTGRFGGQALQLEPGTSSRPWGRNFTASRTAGCNGFAFKSTAAVSSSGVLAFGVVSNGAPQFGFYINGSGGLVCALGRSDMRYDMPAGAVLGTSAPGVIPGNTYVYLEVEWTLSSSSATINVFLEGINVLSITGVGNMAQTGVGYTTGDAWFVSGYSSTSGDYYTYDDYQEVGTNTRVGTMRIDVVKSASDNSVAWTPNSGGNNWSRVSETLVDGDTSYVSSSTPGQQDLYGVSALPVTPATIYGVQRVDFARKTDANPRTLYQTVKSGATTDQGTAKGLLTGYGRLERMLVVDPNTSAAWGAAAVTALLIGPNLAS
jgi:hypothetical protein